jgi:hypothetical protein
MMDDDLILLEDELSPRLRAWLKKNQSDASVVAMEQLSDGRVRLRRLPEIDPLLLAHVRVTMGYYNEALLNLTRASI